MTKIIGIAGYKRSGKGEVGKAIKSVCEDRTLHAVTLGFADKVKIAACKMLGRHDLTDAECVEYMDNFKEHGFVDSGDVRFASGSRYNKSITGREFLQYIGTEVGRDLFGADFWVDQVLPHHGDDVRWAKTQVARMYPDASVVALTDLRFPNEAQRVLDLGGEVWWVARDEVTRSSDHISEAGLDGTYITRVILNSGSLLDLRYKVERALGV